MEIIGCNESEILAVSGKTGEGVSRLLEEIIARVPAPKYEYTDRPRALIFDFEYSEHQGMIVYVRVTDGAIKRGDELMLGASKERFVAGKRGRFLLKKSLRISFSRRDRLHRHQYQESQHRDSGRFRPFLSRPVAFFGRLSSAETGGLGQHLPGVAGRFGQIPPIFGAAQVVGLLSFLRRRIQRGAGARFRCGFLGMLHLEIIMERLKREHNLKLIAAVPTITYKVEMTDGKTKEIYSPMNFPDDSQINKIYEPWVDMRIIIPPERIGQAVQLLYEHEAEVGEVEQFGLRRSTINVKMSLRELMRNFFDALKSATAGYGSLNYKIAEMREAAQGKRGQAGYLGGGRNRARVFSDSK